jgi:hypothetical protein
MEDVVRLETVNKYQYMVGLALSSFTLLYVYMLNMDVCEVGSDVYIYMYIYARV